MSGPFYFSWVLAAENNFGPQHVREDEDVFSFQLDQTEGDFAQLTLTLRNPRIGLLAPGRKVWAWFSWRSPAGDVKPLFFGRLIGVPDNVFAEMVTLHFVARPSNYAAQKIAMADSLKVAPFWDPIWIQEQKLDDPDTVLESRSQLWHIDRVTHAVSVSDVLTGEDGLIVLQQDDVLQDTMEVTLNNTPLRSVSVDAMIPWLQSANDGLDISSSIHAAWPNEPENNTGMQTTFTPEGMIQSWPKAEAGIGAGWKVTEGSAVNLAYVVEPNEAEVGDFFFGHRITFPLPAGSLILPTRVTQGKAYGGINGAGFDVSVDATFAPLGWLKTSLSIGYDVNREFAEHVTFTLKADVQAIVTLPEEDDALLLTFSANDVSKEIDGSIPIGDVRRNHFLDLDRGQQALEYLLCVARAHLLIRSRAVEISFQSPFEKLVDVTLRKNIRVPEPRLPGGEALGKVIGYTFALDGADGALTATVKIGSAVGYGGSYSAQPGDPLYVEAGYVETGYQQYENQIIVPTFGEVAYSRPLVVPNDDGINFIRGFDASTAIQNLTITNGPGFQRAVMRQGIDDDVPPGFIEPWVPEGAYDQSLIKDRLQLVPTTVHLELTPIGKGPYQTEYEIEVLDLEVPAMINLEAPSAP